MPQHTGGSQDGRMPTKYRVHITSKSLSSYEVRVDCRAQLQTRCGGCRRLSNGCRCISKVHTGGGWPNSPLRVIWRAVVGAQSARNSSYTTDNDALARLLTLEQKEEGRARWSISSIAVTEHVRKAFSDQYLPPQQFAFNANAHGSDGQHEPAVDAMSCASGNNGRQHRIKASEEYRQHDPFPNYELAATCAKSTANTPCPPKHPPSSQLGTRA